MSEFHTPVLVDECTRILRLREGGVYVDATLGGGGHSLHMLKTEPRIKLLGFDQDAEAIDQARAVLKDFIEQTTLIHANFSRLRSELALRRVKVIDGILFDLGVSSHQLNTASRGFSFDREAPLDLRMDRSQNRTAADVVNELGQRELALIFKNYGEELYASRIASAILKARQSSRIESTGQLARIIESVAGTGSRESLKTKVRVFQALRIYLNRELEILPQALRDAINILKPGARIVVISYHSLEDRIVKNVFRDAASGCICPPQALKCVCGHKALVTIITKSPVSASETEIGLNVRSRGAKLRAAEKIMGES